MSNAKIGQEISGDVLQTVTGGQTPGEGRGLERKEETTQSSDPNNGAGTSGNNGEQPRRKWGQSIINFFNNEGSWKLRSPITLRSPISED